ncbi:MAG: PepSY-associated TM helix domain-containing protein [Gammaproteobacteria bacterium]
MFRLIHRYTAFSAGTVLLLQSLSGALLIIEKPLDRWIFERFYGTGMANSHDIGYDGVYRTVTSLRPDDRVVFIRSPDAHEGVYEIILNDFSGERVYVNASTGKLLGSRPALSVPRNLLLIFHTGFLGGEWLEMTMGYAALIAVMTLISGIVMWSRGWRRLGAGFRWRLQYGRRLLADSHRDIGFITLPVLLFLILTGAAMVFHEWTETALTTLSGQEGRPQRPVPPGNTNPTLPLQQDLDELVQTARLETGGARPSFLSLPTDSTGVISVRLRQPGEWHSNGRNTVVFNPANGDILLAYDVRKTNATQTLLDNIYPLHVGNFGGIPLQSLYFFSGAAVVYFFITGLWLWWQRRKILHSTEPMRGRVLSSRSDV